MEDKLKQEWKEKAAQLRDEDDYMSTIDVFEWWLSKFNDYKSTLQQQVEGMYEKQVALQDYGRHGYNQAIDDVIKIIKEL